LKKSGARWKLKTRTLVSLVKMENLENELNQEKKYFISPKYMIPLIGGYLGLRDTERGPDPFPTKELSNQFAGIQAAGAVLTFAAGVVSLPYIISGIESSIHFLQ